MADTTFKLMGRAVYNVINTVKTEFKSLINTKVLTDVPENAVFTDTIYTHPVKHSIAEITGLQTSLDTALNSNLNDVVDVSVTTASNGQVLTAVDSGSGIVWQNATLPVNHSHSNKSTLDNINQNLSTSSSVMFAGITINGNLTVSGSTTTVNTEQLTVADNIITLNSSVTGTPTENGGIEVERGTSPNVSILYNENADEWQVTNDGTSFGKIWTSINDGSGSGLDADKLGGIASTEYIRYHQQATAPSSAVDGSIWKDTDTGILYMAANDGGVLSWFEV